MNRSIRAWIALIALLFLTMAGLAMQARAAVEEDLMRLTRQLQANPDDTALRREIIALALKQPTPPPLPREARRFMNRGRTALELAEDQQGFLRAAWEFDQAVSVAPWSADAYFNLGVVREKAGRLAGAIESFRLYLLAAPKAEDRTTVEDRIDALEYRLEQAGAAPHQPAAEPPLTLDGDWHAVRAYRLPPDFRVPPDKSGLFSGKATTSGNRFEIRIKESGGSRWWKLTGERTGNAVRGTIESNENAGMGGPGETPFTGEIAADGASVHIEQSFVWSYRHPTWTKDRAMSVSWDLTR